MNQAFNFESLNVYQKSLKLSKNIYLLTQHWPREHLYGIIDQIRRATLSIVLNIAEGSSRTKKDFRHFITMSRGSCFECIPIIQIAQELKLLSQQDYQIYYDELTAIAQMLSKLRTSLSSEN